MSIGFRSPKLIKAICHAIREAELAYEFCPGSYNASALNACLAVEQVYQREADPIALYLDHHHDITSNPTTNRARTNHNHHRHHRHHHQKTQQFWNDLCALVGRSEAMSKAIRQP